MELTRENILERTQRGLKIYSSIHHRYFPEQGLVLSNNICRAVRNPFYGKNDSLIFFLEGNIAQHQDLEMQEFKGDVFNFAQQHFKTNDPTELYSSINLALKLGLKMPEDAPNWLDTEDDSWRPEFSFYKPPISNTLPNTNMNLAQVHELITGSAFEGITNKLRSLETPEERRAFKATSFPYVSFAGTFSKRNDKAMLTSSGLLVLDFDHLPNLKETKELLLSDEYYDTELLFTSPSGDGLKWIIRNDMGVPHRYMFNAVCSYLKKKYQLEADPSGKDLSRSCFLCQDRDSFLHARHRVLELME